MTQDNIVKFAEPGTFEDPLTEVLRSGARKLLALAIEAEISDFLERKSGFLTEQGQQRLVRHGHLPVHLPPGQRLESFCARAWTFGNCASK